MSSCRGCGGTCCTGVGSEACSCPPAEESAQREPRPGVAGLLRALGDQLIVRQPDGSHLAKCPAHEGQDPSLVIREFRDATLIRCHSGCSVNEVLTVLNMTTADLFNHGK